MNSNLIKKTNEERLQILSQAIGNMTFRGNILLEKDEANYSAILSVPGEKVNNVLHIVLIFVTCALWLIVWIILILSARKETRIRITIDEYGNQRTESYVIK